VFVVILGADIIKAEHDDKDWNDGSPSTSGTKCCPGGISNVCCLPTLVGCNSYQHSATIIDLLDTAACCDCTPAVLSQPFF